MSATMNVHGPYTYEPHIYREGTEYVPAPYVSFRVEAPGAKVYLYLMSAEAADALVTAATAARALFDGVKGGTP